MATYQFASDSQLMFSVMLFDGKRVIVHFTERGGNGMSSYLTSDEKVARAIMNHSFFRRGRIVLVGKSQTGTEPEPQQKKEEAASQEQPAAQEAGTPAAEPEQGAAEETHLNFENITFAKDYLNRTYGVNKTDIRSMSKIIAFAESKGLTITIGSSEE